MLKDEILKLLYTQRVMLSGEALAARFGVSRNAVWKAVKQLQKEGFAVTASTNKGYFLEGCGRTLSPVVLEAELQDAAFGKPLHFHSTLDSTNIKAKALAETGAPGGTVVLAESQTAGKGRLGRTFYSPAQQGVYFSLLLRPESFGENAMLLTSMCAVATAEAIEAVAPVKVQIKWVNDLLIKGKKVCGILTEAGFCLEEQRMDYVIVGIGVNCGPQAFPPELRDIATSIENETGIPLNRSLLVAEILKRIEIGLKTMENRAFLSACRSRSALLGKTVTVYRGAACYSATAVGIDDEGALQVKTQDGVVQSLVSGEVRVRL
ncbi:MAG: biotin--[Clostridia bacterium]|nr:biotin--[acetyl-CoA-carboxylase] ligase [Clostridia bacterium]